MPSPKPLLKEDIERAMRVTASNKAAARYLNVCYQHYRKYAKLYTNPSTGKTLLEEHGNRGGKGVPKLTTNQTKTTIHIRDIVEGKIDPAYFHAHKIRERLVVDGFLEEKCYHCGFNERRVLDYKVPLILNFKDGNKNNYLLDNIEFLCYNCYFLYVGKVFSEIDVKQLESETSINNTTRASNLELDDYNIKKLIENKHLPEDGGYNIYDIVPKKL